MRHVLVAGAGVGAIECVLALRELAGSRFAVELLAPAAELVHRPSAVETPFGGEPAARVDLRQLAGGLGVRLHRDALASVDPAKPSCRAAHAGTHLRTACPVEEQSCDEGIVI
jgi:sulfide:quinone oxidoreductase